jgi:hypothetical protein
MITYDAPSGEIKRANDPADGWMVALTFRIGPTAASIRRAPGGA